MSPIIDHYPSITAGDLNHAADLLGLYGSRPDAYPPDVKADLVKSIRTTVQLRIGYGMVGIPAEFNPDLLALLGKAEGDCPE